MSDDKQIIESIPRSTTEQLQIAINEFKGKKYLDLRIFYTTDSGETWLPTKKGVTVQPEHLQLLKDAIEKSIKALSGKE